MSQYLLIDPFFILYFQHFGTWSAGCSEAHLSPCMELSREDRVETDTVSSRLDCWDGNDNTIYRNQQRQITCKSGGFLTCILVKNYGAGGWRPPLFSCRLDCDNLSGSSITVQDTEPLDWQKSLLFEGSKSTALASSYRVSIPEQPGERERS